MMLLDWSSKFENGSRGGWCSGPWVAIRYSYDEFRKTKTNLAEVCR
jgi:hypothetical protein